MEIILSGAQDLEAMPEMGRPMNDDTGRRELFMPFGAGAYVLRYRLDTEAVVIIRIWHSREHRVSRSLEDYRGTGRIGPLPVASESLAAIAIALGWSRVAQSRRSACRRIIVEGQCCATLYTQ